MIVTNDQLDRVVVKAMECIASTMISTKPYNEGYSALRLYLRDYMIDWLELELEPDDGRTRNSDYWTYVYNEKGQG